MKFCEKRKKLLLQMDRGKEVGNAELGMYDLTPYFKESYDDSIVEKIMYVKNESRLVNHIKDKKIYFSPPQVEALDFLYKNNRCILSAPTSFGKTMIIKEYIHKYSPKKIVYIVPTNSLAYELECSFKQNPEFKKYDIFDREKTRNNVNHDIQINNYFMFIGTQEKFLEIKDSIFSNIDLFVIDEAYKLEETTKEQRGYKLSEVYLDSISKQSEKIFLLSPNATFTGFEKYDFKIYESYYNAVDKVYHLINKQDFYKKVYEKGRVGKTLVFFDSPSLINKNIKYFVDNSYIEVDINNSFINFLEKEYHPDWSIVKMLKKGILIHHGQMPKYIQNKIINMFNNKTGYNLLLGTNSISEGINTPTKYLFIHPDSINIRERKLLLKNTIGRAGRLGEYPIGHIYSCFSINDIIKNKIEICLSISKDEEIQEIYNTSDERVIDDLCNEFNIEKDFYDLIRKETKLSIYKIRVILETLKIHQLYCSLSNLPFMAEKVFSEYRNARIDKYCIKGVLQWKYKKENIFYNLKSYDEKINYYKLKTGNQSLSNSTIIDYYMRFIYSTLEYYILPIAKIARIIYEWNPEWDFGNNVIETMKLFWERYNSHILSVYDYDKFTEEQKIILQSLREYGIQIKRNIINHEMIKEIENQLNVRYSTYDIINAIRRLSEKSVKNRLNFKYINDMYLS